MPRRNESSNADLWPDHSRWHRPTCASAQRSGLYRLGRSWRSARPDHELNTTATSSALITVCIDYNGVSYQNEAELRVLHFEDGQWVINIHTRYG